MYLYIILALIILFAVFLYLRPAPVSPAQPKPPVLVNSKPLYDWNGVYSGDQGNMTLVYDGTNLKITFSANATAMSQFVENNFAGFIFFGLRNNGKTLDYAEISGKTSTLTKISGNVNPIGVETSGNSNFYDSPLNGTWNLNGAKFTLQRQDNKINYITNGLILAKFAIEPDGSLIINDTHLVLDGDKLNYVFNGQTTATAVRVGN